jgi:nicotinic acid mononucleotide adenylyltransferase
MDNPNTNRPFCSRRAIEKVRMQLTFASSSQRLAFVVMSGSFNPVHTDHVTMLNIAKKHSEILGWKIVGGFLALSTDAYVKSKCGVNALPLQQRKALCEVAIQDLAWLSICSRGELSSNLARRSIQQELEGSFAEILGGRSLIGIEIMGSDTVVRLVERIVAQNDNAVKAGQLTQRGRIIQWFLRPGANSMAQKNHIETLIAPGAAKLGIKLVATEPTRWGLPLKGISSNEIRKLASTGHWETLRQNGWLAPAVLRLLEKWASSRRAIWV